jgi:GNAT superfamily N-acetyltransferase
MSVWVAVRENQQVVGTVALKSVSRHRGHLRGMAVLPEFQGTGLASALLRTAIRAAAKNGERRVTLETTEPLERATQFYLRHGFRTSGRRRQWGGMKLIEFERAVPTRVLPHRGTREVGRVPDVQVT